MSSSWQSQYLTILLFISIVSELSCRTIFTLSPTIPITMPTSLPSNHPTTFPTSTPSHNPSNKPTTVTATSFPSLLPTSAPTLSPSSYPSSFPTKEPSTPSPLLINKGKEVSSLPTSLAEESVDSGTTVVGELSVEDSTMQPNANDNSFINSYTEFLIIVGVCIAVVLSCLVFAIMILCFMLKQQRDKSQDNYQYPQHRPIHAAVSSATSITLHSFKDVNVDTEELNALPKNTRGEISDDDPDERERDGGSGDSERMFDIVKPDAKQTADGGDTLNMQEARENNLEKKDTNEENSNSERMYDVVRSDTQKKEDDKIEKDNEKNVEGDVLDTKQ